MATQEDIVQQQQLLVAYRRTLAVYLQQQALMGSAFVPPHVMNGIYEARDNIRRIKSVLREWGVDVSDHPDDEDVFVEKQQPEPLRGEQEKNDPYISYERGLKELIRRIGGDNPRFLDALIYQQRLAENINNVRLFGDNADRRMERASIIAALDRLSASELGVTFNEISNLEVAENANRVSSSFDNLHYIGTLDVAEILTPSSALRAEWEQARTEQQRAKGAYHVVPELQAFVDHLCRTLDFSAVPDSYHLHHDQIVACRIRTPTLHLNLPNELLLFLVVEKGPSEDLLNRLSDIPLLTQASGDFGLVLIPEERQRFQEMINQLIRPAMKSDFIVLDGAFLDEIADSTRDSQTVLMSAVLREVDLTHISPFMAGGADLPKHMFFGREDVLRNISQSINKTSVALRCGRRMGKTTLLRRLEQVVLPAREYPCFFLDCQTVHDYDELRMELVGATQKPEIPFDPQNPNSLGDVAKALIGPKGQPPVFLLDEIDGLLRYDSQHELRLFTRMRALSQAGQARFIVSGERMVQNQLRDSNSPLFNFFGLKPWLSFLDWAAVNKLVTEPMQDMQIVLRDPLAAAQTIFNYTSGHPYLVQRLCQEIVLTISRQGVRVIEPEHIDIALNDSAYQEEYFDTLWGQVPILGRIISLLIDSRGATLPEIQKLLEQHNIKPNLSEIIEALDLLSLYSVVVRKLGRYFFLATYFPAMRQRTFGDDIETNLQAECERYLWTQLPSSTMEP